MGGGASETHVQQIQVTYSSFTVHIFKSKMSSITAKPTTKTFCNVDFDITLKRVTVCFFFSDALFKYTVRDTLYPLKQWPERL